MILDYSKLIINYSNSRPGSGKTFDTLKRIATSPGKYLYAVDRIDVFNERRMLIQRLSTSNDLRIVELNSEISNNVRQDVFDTPSAYANDSHVVAICTHEALMSSDLSHYRGWKLCIDEIPNAWIHHEVSTKVSKGVLARYFTIRKSRDKGGAYRISVKQNMDIQALAEDSFLNEIMPLYKAAKNGKAYCAIASFDEADKWDWWSFWNFKELEVFETVSIVGNAFEESLTFKLMQSQGVQLRKFTIPEFTSYKPHNLIIRYFDENNRATSYFFKSPIGKDALKAVGRYLQKQNIDIWSCNHKKLGVDYTKLIGVKNGKLFPSVAGSNAYAAYTSAAFIFSAKPGKTEMGRLQAMGIEFEDVVRSREIEPMIQFVTRLSIRNPDDDRDCTFFVYDKTQAEAIKGFFDNLDIGITTTLVHADLGIPLYFKSVAAKKAAKSAVNKAAYRKKKGNK